MILFQYETVTMPYGCTVGIENLMQDDGIHPNAAAQPRLLDNAWPIIVEALAQ